MSSRSESAEAFVLNRPCDNKPCLICRKNILCSETGATIAIPHKALKKALKSKSDKPALNWRLDKVVDYLHYQCWESATTKTKKTVNAADLRLLLTAGEDSLERFDTEEDLRAGVAQVLEKVLASRQIVCFTGAGISVAAGLMTYRGTEGIDTQEELGIDESAKKSSKRKGNVAEEVEDNEEEDVDYTKLKPTRTHYAIARLNELEKLSYCITQNCDDLHAKAGLDRNCIADLHGNVFVEYCERCLTQYFRDFCVDINSTDCLREDYARKCETCGWNHYTGRKCDAGRCRGKLRDTIVNFGDDLHAFGICGGMMRATSKARHSDLCICLGSSLAVGPANLLPFKSKDCVIVNLQSTDFDDEASVRIWGRSDDFFDLLMPQIEAALGEAKKKGKNNSKKRVKKSEPKEHFDNDEDFDAENNGNRDVRNALEEEKPKPKKRQRKGKGKTEVIDMTLDE